MSGSSSPGGRVVHHVWVQLRAPQHGDAGEVTPVFYRLDEDMLTLTDAAGSVLASSEGIVWQDRLYPGDEPARIARRLARKSRNAASSAFNRRTLAYPKLVIV